MCGLFACLGQLGVHAFSKSSSGDTLERPPLLQRMANSRLMPLRALPDRDYEEMLTEKLVRAETEIAMIDEQIAALRSTRDGQASQKTSKSSP